MAVRAGIEGTVVVEVRLDTSGAVVEARAVSGHPLLRDAAVAAARQWKFKPAAKRVVGTIAMPFRK